MMPSSLQNIQQHQMWERPIGKDMGLISCDKRCKNFFSGTYYHHNGPQEVM
jgi:hypothetical protein